MRLRTAIPATAALLLLASAPQLEAADWSVAFEAGYFDMTGASKSANAVFGSSGGFTWGGEVGVSLGEHFFVAAGARYFNKSGERVFVADASGEAFPLGHPLEMKLVPVFVSVGYRFGDGRLRPYVGAGGGFTSYKEESTVAGISESLSETKASGHVLAGVEFGSGRARVGAEIVWSFVPNAIGVGGVSQVYGESDVGGLHLLGKIVFGGR